jgi:hemerythrin-like domain-containing protein
MESLESGLRFRLRRAARQIAQQHQSIREILASLERSLGEGERARDGVRGLFARYREAVEAHFAMEEDVLFPALHGLHPSRSAELEALEAEHGEFGARLGGLAELLAGTPLSEFADRFDGFARQMAMHETREERLAQSLAERVGEE